jgi:hypothetical protein
MLIFLESTNYWLKKQCKKLNIKLNGIYLNNKKDLDTIKWKNGFYIINMAQSPPGTHWVALAIPSDKKFALYFDSYGVIPDDSIRSCLKKQNIKDIYFSQYAIQSLDSKACGHFCLAFMDFMNNNNIDSNAYEDFLNIFTPYSRKNELLLLNFFK